MTWNITCNTQVRLITARVCVHATCIMVYTNMKLWSVWYVIMVEVKLIWYTFYNINCMTVTSYTNIQAMIPNEFTALKINRLMDMHAWSQGIYSIAICITPHGIIYEKCTIPYRPLYTYAHNGIRCTLTMNYSAMLWQPTHACICFIQLSTSRLK